MHLKLFSYLLYQPFGFLIEVMLSPLFDLFCEYLITAYNKYVNTEDKVELTKSLRYISIIGLVMAFAYFLTTGIFIIVGKENSVNIYLTIFNGFVVAYTLLKSMSVFKKKKTDFNIIKHSSAYVDFLCLSIYLISVIDSLLRYHGMTSESVTYKGIISIIIIASFSLIVYESVTTMKLCKKYVLEKNGESKNELPIPKEEKAVQEKKEAEKPKIAQKINCWKKSKSKDISKDK